MSEAVETYETVVKSKPDLVLKVGWIYMWVHKDRPEIILYVGSTHLTIKERREAHNNQYKTSPRSLHRWAKKEKCWNSLRMTPVAQVQYYTTSQLKDEEFRYQSLLRPQFGYYARLNKERKNKTRRKWWKDNNDRMREYGRQLYRKNAIQVHCPCAGNLLISRKSTWVEHEACKKHQRFINQNPDVKVPTVEDYKEWRVKPLAES